MHLRGNLGGMFYILWKDLRAYYFKPPNLSWGIFFPLVLTLAFTLRDPTGIADLAPGLIAMAAVFGTTSMEAIVITFERRTGALERLLLAPISTMALMLAKILGGAVFGAMISGVMILVAVSLFGMVIMSPLLFFSSLLLTLLTLSALGALVAVSVKEVFEAQTLSNFFRFPMIFVCGVFLPVETMPLALQVVAHSLPLTYSVYALKTATSGIQDLVTPLMNLAALAMFFIVFLVACEWVLKRTMK
ncbi:MAG: ABC transporter permease [Promethearchaeia archaeon]